MTSAQLRRQILHVFRDAWKREGLQALVNLDDLRDRTKASEEDLRRETEYLAAKGLLRDFTEQGLVFAPTTAGIDAAQETEAEDSLIPKPSDRSNDGDSVTSLCTRRVFDEDVVTFGLLAARHGAPLACLFVDVDKFKIFNDQYGHAKGDEVLRGVADQLAVAVREKGRAYRYGGEELVALLANHTRAEAAAVAERVRKAVECWPIAGISQSVTVSIGVGAYPEDCAAPAELVALADKAMYRAKDGGRNRVALCVEHDPISSQAVRPTASESDLEDIVAFAASFSVDVRMEAAQQLLALSYGAVLTHLPSFFEVLRRLLSDAHPTIRRTALLVFGSAITRTESAVRPQVIDRYVDVLLMLAQHDPSPEVRAQAILAAAQTGDARFIEWFLVFLCEWNDEAYGSAGIVAGFNGLAIAGLGKTVRTALLHALEGAITEKQRERLRECLNSVNQIIHRA